MLFLVLIGLAEVLKLVTVSTIAGTFSNIQLIPGGHLFGQIPVVWLENHRMFSLGS